MPVYAFSDLHGNYGLWSQIKRYLAPGDRAYCLGDCADKGTDGWHIIKEIAMDERITYIQGNHEDMLAKAIDGDPYLLFMNWGQSTYESWIADGANPAWANYLRRLPLRAEYNKRQLSHAGFTPGATLTKEKLLWDRSHIKDEWLEEYPDIYIVHGHTPADIVEYAPDKKGIFHKYDIDCSHLGMACLLNLDTLEKHYFKEV